MSDATFFTQGNYVPYTAATAVSKGDIVKLADGRAGFADEAIAAGDSSYLRVRGVVEVNKVTGAINAGMPVGFDNNGSSVAGTASAGAATILLAVADTVMGAAYASAASTDPTVKVQLNEFSPAFPYWANRVYATVTTATLALAQSGYVLQCATDAQTLTLPAIADVTGLRDVIIQNCNVDGKLLTIEADGTEKLVGNGVAITALRLVNTAATAKQGDYVQLGQAIPAVAQFVVAIKGVWAAPTT